MNILRLSTFSLTLAIAVFAFSHVNPASAEKPGANCDPMAGPVHSSCKDDEGGDDAIYDVDITGLVTFSSQNHWITGSGRNKIVPGATHTGTFTDMTPLAAFFGDDSDTDQVSDGVECFLAPFQDLVFAAHITQGKGGRIEVGLWFGGKTWEGDDILYVLFLFGPRGQEQWPPDPDQTTVINIIDWDLSVSNEGQAIKDISCIGEGPIPEGLVVPITTLMVRHHNEAH